MARNPQLKVTNLEIVENQIQDNDPPETKQTLERLMTEGHSEQEAREMIGRVVLTEVFDILKNNEPYDNERFVSALHKLP